MNYCKAFSEICEASSVQPFTNNTCDACWKLKRILKKHAGHNVSVWEKNCWNITLNEKGKAQKGKGEAIAVELDIADGGIDEATLPHCHTCNEDIDATHEYFRILDTAISER